MARFTRKINKENKTVTVTDNQTGASRTGRYHDSLPMEETARQIEDDLTKFEARGYDLAGEERQASVAREELSRQRPVDGGGFISKQQLSQALQAGSGGESGMEFSKEPMASGGGSDPAPVDVGSVPMVDQSNFGPVNTGSGAGKAAQGLSRDRNMYDIEQEPITQAPDPMLGKNAYMAQVRQERAQEKNLADEARKQKGTMDKIIAQDSFETGGRPIDYSEALTNLEGGDLKPRRASGLMEEVLMSDTSPKLMEESTIRGDDPVTRLTEDIVQTSGQAAQADIDAALEQEDARFAQAQKRSGIMNDPSQMRAPQSEDEAKYGLGAETTEQALQGAGPTTLEEQTIKTDDPPEVLEMKQLQVDAQKKKPGAVQARKEMFAGLPREAKAMAKEELGDYYVDPNSGLAINLTELDASANRRANMMMLQHVPKHQRATMMANWGYIDKEDVENLPEDPQIQKAKIDAANNIAVQKMREEGSNARTGMQTSASLAIANLQDNTARTLGVRKLDLQEARDGVADRIATGELTIKQAAQELAKTLGVKQEDRLQEMMEQEFAFKYEEMEGMDAFRTSQLAQQNTQWTADFMRKGKNEQKAWLLKKHSQAMSDIKWAMENYQFDAAATFASENGINLVPNIEMKMKKDAAKLAKKDLATGAVATLARQHLKVTAGAKTGDVNKFLNNYHQSRVKIVAKLSDPQEDVNTGMRAIDMAFQEYGIPSFEEAPDAGQFANPAHYRIAKTQFIIEQEMTKAHGPFHAKYKNLEMQIQRGNNKGGGDTTGTTTPTTTPTPKPGEDTTEKESPPPATTETELSAVESAIPTVPNLEEQILGTPRYKGMGKQKALNDSLDRGKKDLQKLIDYEKSKGGKSFRRFENKKEAIEYFSKNPDELGEGYDPDASFLNMGFTPGAVSNNALYYILREMENAF